jgi:hypothetical protein
MPYSRHLCCHTTLPEHSPILALGDDAAAICAGGLGDMLAWVRSACQSAATAVGDVGVQVDLTAITENTVAVLVSEGQA